MQFFFLPFCLHHTSFFLFLSPHFFASLDFVSKAVSLSTSVWIHSTRHEMFINEHQIENLIYTAKQKWLCAFSEHWKSSLATFYKHVEKLYLGKTVSKESKVTMAEVKTYFRHCMVKYSFLCAVFFILTYPSHYTPVSGRSLARQTPSCWVGVQLDQTPLPVCLSS